MNVPCFEYISVQSHQIESLDHLLSKLQLSQRPVVLVLEHLDELQHDVIKKIENYVNLASLHISSNASLNERQDY